MSKAFRIHQTGGPEVMRWEDVEVGEPGPGQVRLRHTAVAGGVGLIMCQWAKHLGATVIGTVGSRAKAEVARASPVP